MAQLATYTVHYTAGYLLIRLQLRRITALKLTLFCLLVICNNDRFSS